MKKKARLEFVGRIDAGILGRSFVLGLESLGKMWNRPSIQAGSWKNQLTYAVPSIERN